MNNIYIFPNDGVMALLEREHKSPDKKTEVRTKYGERQDASKETCRSRGSARIDQRARCRSVRDQREKDVAAARRAR